MKVWERVVEARLRKVVEICEQQYGFMPRKSTTDAIFALRILMEKYRDGQRELHCVFVDLEKAYDRVPREELWYCMRKSGVAEKYVRVVQDMYERSRTVVRCAVGQTEEFNVEVGLHQGSALSPFLFAIVMDQLSEEVRQESPWTMMFADDIVICSESREKVEENLERWRFALERRGMKVSRSKTEYMCVNEREGSGTVRLQGEEVKKVQEFKYLGSTVQSNGECGKEVKKRVQAGWNGWRKVSGVLCDRKISARIKGKVYRTVVRPAMLYGLETVSLRKRQESELEVAELKMLRFSLGVTRLDRIRNEYIRGTAHVGRLGDKVREARLRWFGHVQRRETKRCPGPESPQNGKADFDAIVYKSIITYSCLEGYILDGATQSKCLHTGQWSQPTPECKPVVCDLPVIPPYAKIVYDRQFSGDTVEFMFGGTYECLPPMALFGEKRAICTANGTWSKPPECKLVTCPVPIVIENGFLTFAEMREHGYKEKVKYGCNHPYILDEAAEVECQETGSWSKIPECKAPCKVNIKRGRIFYKGMKTWIEDFNPNQVLHSESVIVYCLDEQRNCGYPVSMQCSDGQMPTPACYQ
ncbi:hypothetical protein QTP70_024241, partial [Hemibagrus guttatus]